MEPAMACTTAGLPQDLPRRQGNKLLLNGIFRKLIA